MGSLMRQNRLNTTAHVFFDLNRTEQSVHALGLKCVDLDMIKTLHFYERSHDAPSISGAADDQGSPAVHKGNV